MTRPDYTSLEQRLIAALHQEASLAMTTTDTQRELQRWHDDHNKRKNRFRIGVAVACAAAVAAIVLGIVYGFAGSTSTKREPIHKPPAPAPVAPKAVSLSTLGALPAGTDVTTTKGPVNPGSVAFGALWATGLEETENNLYRLDPATGDILSTGHFSPNPTVAPVPTRVGDRVLVASERGYDVLDKSGARVGVIRTDLPGAVAGDASGGWVQLDSTTIARLDASATQIQQRVHVAKSDSATFVKGIAVAGDALYVATSSPNAVSRLDAATGQVIDTMTLSPVPAAVLATDSAVYVPTETYEMLRIDPALNSITAVSKNDIELGSYFIPFVGPGDSLWVTPNQGGIVELDPTTLRPLRSFELRHNNDPGWNFGGAVTRSRAFVGSVRQGAVLSIPLS